MLNEQLQKEINQEAKAEAKKLTGRVPIFRMGYEAGHYDGAEKYAEKWQEAQQQVEQLTQWKKETKLLLDPILDWGQSNKNVPLGASITEEVLSRAKEHDKLKAKVERYENALKDVQAKAKRGIFPHLPVETMGSQMCIEINQYVTDLLTPKTGSDDR